MFLHQTENTFGTRIYNAYQYKNIQFYEHLHKSFEAICVFEGEIDGEICDKPIKIKAGECAFVPSFARHKYSTPQRSECVVFVFSEDYVKSFTNFITAKSPLSYSFAMTETLSALVKATFPDEVADGVVYKKCKDPINDYEIKSLCYALISGFVYRNEFIEKQLNTEIFGKIVNYLENNFDREISLKTLCKFLGYNYAYTSRLFKAYFNASFSDLLNQYRFEQAKKLIALEDRTLTDIGMASGFQSIRNFNRVFKELSGMTPAEYKMQL